MIDKLKQDIIKNKYIILLVIIYLAILQIFFSTLCPIKVLFNIECPGCGLTRASVYILKLDFVSAFNTNYAVFFWWAFILILIIDRYIYKFKIKIVPIVFAITCIITLFRYFVLIHDAYISKIIL